MLTIILVVCAASSAAFILLIPVYFVMAERVLRDYRSRYPAEWKSRGEPTFVSFAVLGERWWRPITAFNFFYCRKYLELGDPELAQRADRVRVLQNVAWGIPNVWLLLGVFVFVLYR